MALDLAGLGKVVTLVGSSVESLITCGLWLVGRKGNHAVGGSTTRTTGVCA